MLAIREEQQLSFFEYTSKDDVREWLEQEYQLATDYYDDSFQIMNPGNIASSMMEIFLHELFLRQLNVGDVMMFATREECIEAYDDDEKMDQIMSDALEVVSYSGMFGERGSYTSEFEQLFIDDVILLLEEGQYMYSTIPRPSDAGTEKVFTGDLGISQRLHNCVLQEVW